MSRVYALIPGTGFRIPRIAEVMKETCEFRRYQDGNLWYVVEYKTERYKDLVREEYDVWQFEFPIPVGDAGSGAFGPEMKALNLMRWIRKHIEFLTEAKRGDGEGA